jgi:tetratricopeptide (TPR) repeat protein
VIAADPRHGEALLALGRLETAERHWTEAESHLTRAVALQSAGDVRPLLALARVRNLKGNTEGALALSLQATRTAPNDAGARYAVGVLCLQMDLLKDATENLEKAVALERTPANQYALASARIAQRNFPAAIEIYRTLLQSNPADAQLNYALGTAYFLANEDTQAQGAFEASLAAKPDQVESPYYLALLADRRGNREQSIELLRGVIQRQPDHARAHMALGLAYRADGDLNGAATELETATRLQPDNQKAHYQLGLALAALKKQAEAKQELALASRLRQSSDDKVSWELAPAAEAGHVQ